MIIMEDFATNTPQKEDAICFYCNGKCLDNKKQCQQWCHGDSSGCESDHFICEYCKGIWT